MPDRRPRRGGRWRDHRQVIDAIAFKYRTGTPWMDLPARFGSWKGVHNRLRK
ncbi:Mobile element protein [Streptomyces venezuelae]|nr:Mobile element protein [Streptomyces venezuelae]